MCISKPAQVTNKKIMSIQLNTSLVKFLEWWPDGYTVFVFFTGFASQKIYDLETGGPNIFSNIPLGKGWCFRNFLLNRFVKVFYISKVWDWPNSISRTESLHTLPETNIAPENRPSEKETSIPTIHSQVLCWFQGCITLLLLLGVRHETFSLRGIR